MRTLHINTRPIKYQNVASNPEAIRDADGNLTGEYTSGYGAVLTARVNVSPATGIVTPSYFGADINYDRVIAVDKDFEINERTRLWIDDLEAERHDYVVKRVARSINGCLVAISKVNTYENTP